MDHSVHTMFTFLRMLIFLRTSWKWTETTKTLSTHIQKWKTSLLLFFSDSKIDPKHTRPKERFLIGRNRTKWANFQGSPLFQATYNIKTEKQTINSFYLVSVRCGRLAEGKGHKTDSAEENGHETDWVSLTPFSFHQPPTSTWHKTSWINGLFFCFHVVPSLKKRTSSKICTFCPVPSN